MELNRDQIIKALECCTYGGDQTKSQVEVCSPCPYFYEGNCTQVLKEHALALIKELTEEDKKLKAEADRLVAEIDDGILTCNSICQPKYEAEIKQAKADTVRKMNLRFKDELLKSEGRLHFTFVLCEMIDQIAKEILDSK